MPSWRLISRPVWIRSKVIPQSISYVRHLLILDCTAGEASSLDSREGECPIFPLIVFTHGLGGNRTTSSTLLGEFASYGFVVVSMEHRDGSGARTFINHPPKGHGSRDATDGVVDHSKEDLKHDYDRIDYVFPQGMSFLTASVRYTLTAVRQSLRHLPQQRSRHRPRTPQSPDRAPKSRNPGS